jgi:hypothetical protein
MGNSVGDLPDIAGIDLSDLSSAPASGTANKQADFTFQLTENGKGVIITGLSGNPKTVNIPSKFEGVPVVEIGNNAFEDHFGITSITIPNTVTKIGSSAFSRTGITKIVIPDSVTEMGSFLLNGCKMLTEVKLSDNISKLNILGASRWPSGVKKINLPKNLIEISSVAFIGFPEITDLVIPDTITKLTFISYYQDEPLEEGEIPETFKGCQKLSIKTRQRLKQLGYNGEF